MSPTRSTPPHSTAVRPTAVDRGGTFRVITHGRANGRGDAGGLPLALAVVFTLVESAWARRRTIASAHLVAWTAWAPARFEDGILVEHEEEAA